MSDDLSARLHRLRAAVAGARPPDLPEHLLAAWARVRAVMDWAPGHWLGWIGVDPLGAGALLREVRAALGPQLEVISLDEGLADDQALERLLAPSHPPVALAWVACGGPRAEDLLRWRRVHLLLNERRERLARARPGGVLFVGPAGALEVAREAAPDLWTMRSLALWPAADVDGSHLKVLRALARAEDVRDAPLRDMHALFHELVAVPEGRSRALREWTAAQLLGHIRELRARVEGTAGPVQGETADGWVFFVVAAVARGEAFAERELAELLHERRVPARLRVELALNALRLLSRGTDRRALASDQVAAIAVEGLRYALDPDSAIDALPFVSPLLALWTGPYGARSGELAPAARALRAHLGPVPSGEDARRGAAALELALAEVELHQKQTQLAIARLSAAAELGAEERPEQRLALLGLSLLALGGVRGTLARARAALVADLEAGVPPSAYILWLNLARRIAAAGGRRWVLLRLRRFVAALPPDSPALALAVQVLGREMQLAGHPRAGAQAVHRARAALASNSPAALGLALLEAELSVEAGWWRRAEAALAANADGAAGADLGVFGALSFALALARGDLAGATALVARLRSDVESMPDGGAALRWRCSTWAIRALPAAVRRVDDPKRFVREALRVVLQLPEPAPGWADALRQALDP